MKKALSIVLALILTACMTVPAMALESSVLTTDAFDPVVRLSVTDTYTTGTGLGFCFTLNADNITQNENTHAVQLANATLTYQGEPCAITEMGAVVTHLSRLNDESKLTRAAAEDHLRVLDITAKKMYRTAEDYAMYAVRVTDIPFEQEDTTLYARPYVVIQYEGESVTLYGAITSASYTSAMTTANVRLPGYGQDVDGKGRLYVGDTSVLCDTLYIEIQDELDEWTTTANPDRPDKIIYACYDRDGVEVSRGDIVLPAMGTAYTTVVLEAPLAEGTAQVRIVDTEIIYWTDWEL